MQPYGENHRTSRRMLHSFVGSEPALKRLEPLQEIEARRLVQNLQETPEELKNHIRL